MLHLFDFYSKTTVCLNLNKQFELPKLNQTLSTGVADQKKINDLFIILMENTRQQMEGVRHHQSTLVLDPKIVHRSAAQLLTRSITLRQSATLLQLVPALCAIIAFQDFLCSQQM